LYFVGEILDCDGRMGGFNIQCVGDGISGRARIGEFLCDTGTQGDPAACGMSPLEVCTRAEYMYIRSRNIDSGGKRRDGGFVM